MSLKPEMRPRSATRKPSARALQRLPIFPLPELVFFPDTMLPLHIFEPRYRKMTQDALDGNKLLAIGMLLEKERPGEDAPRFADVVGVGEIVIAEPLPDGRFNLVLEGRARVQVEEELVSDEPYRLVKTHAIPDEPARDAVALAEAETSLRAIVEGLCRTLPEGGPLLRQVIAAQDSPAALSNVLASTLVPSARLRQRLLETTAVDVRLETLTRELAALTSRFTEGGETN